MMSLTSHVQVSTALSVEGTDREAHKNEGGCKKSGNDDLRVDRNGKIQSRPEAIS